ncbi:hypothetical protein scyTo_0010202 [Scyliorhinus torazame]|uniref:Uncharacterized protein n=1 Tax=Scyliorhinus torazame TaxID=75743 RepID=A0A401P1X9_SCYTO|nr:hypothetical protein [Scyliorhinus torazame]
MPPAIPKINLEADQTSWRAVIRGQTRHSPSRNKCFPWRLSGHLEPVKLFFPKEHEVIACSAKDFKERKKGRKDFGVVYGCNIFY